MMPSISTFYAVSSWGTRYGVIDKAHQSRHKGLDVGLFHGSVQVPALYDGVVVAVVKNSNVGHYVQVRRANGMFDTYCHIVPGVSQSQVVKRGASLGRQAVTQDEGGVEWLGQHTHLALSDTMGGWGTWGPNNFNPAPGVIAALTSTASNGSNPLPDVPKPIHEQLEGINMETILIRLNDISGVHGAKGTLYFALYTPSTGFAVPITKAGSANNLVPVYGVPVAGGSALATSAFDLAYGDWERIVGANYPYKG